MAAGPITITGAWEDAEGEPASGTVSFQRHDAIQDVAVVIVANQVEVVQLEDDGTLTTEVIAADPDDPNPLARFFRVTERIRHTARAVVYDIELDSDSDPVDLTTVARVTALPAAVYQYEVAGTTAIERERAMAAEEQLASDLAAEIARATAAEDALGALIEALAPAGTPVWPSAAAMLDPDTDVTGGAFTTVDIWDTAGNVFVAGIARSSIAPGTRVVLPSGANAGIWLATATGPYTLADPQPTVGSIGGVNYGPDGPYLLVAASMSGRDPVNLFLEISGIPATVPRTNLPNVFTADQVVKQTLAVVDSGSDPNAEVQNFSGALDEDDTRLAGLIGLAVDLGGGLVVKQAGVFASEWNPLAGAFTGRQALVSYGFIGVDEAFAPVYRFAFNIATDAKIASVLAPERGIIMSGTPVLEDDVVTLGFHTTALAAKADDATVDDLAADVSEAQADIVQLESDAAALAGRTQDVEDVVAALPAPLWQPVMPTDAYGNTVQMADILAGDGTWEVDPAVSLHNLFVDAGDDLTSLGGLLPLIVPNPGPGKWSRFSLNIVNTSAYGFSVAVVGATTGAPSGGASAGYIGTIAVEVWGGDPNPVVLWAYRLAHRPI